MLLSAAVQPYVETGWFVVLRHLSEQELNAYLDRHCAELKALVIFLVHHQIPQTRPERHCSRNVLLPCACARLTPSPLARSFPHRMCPLTLRLVADVAAGAESRRVEALYEPCAVHEGRKLLVVCIFEEPKERNPAVRYAQLFGKEMYR